MSFARRAAVTVSGRVLSSVLYTLSLLLVARFAGPVAFGPLSGMLGAGLFLGAVGDLGMTTFILRRRALDSNSEEIRTALAISRLSLVLTALITAIVGVLLGLNPVLALLVALGLALDKYSDTWQAILIADNRNFLASALVLVRRLLLFSAVLFGSFVAENPLLYFSAGLAASGVVSQLGQSLATRGLNHPPKHSFRSVIGQARAFWLSVMSAQARELDVTMVLLFANPAAAGLYSAGARIARPVLLIAGALANVALPHFSRSGPQQARRACHIIGASALLLVLVGLLAVPAAPLLVKLLLGDGYQSAEPVTAVFLISIGPIALSSVLGSILQANGYQRFVAMNGVVFALVSLIAAATGAHVGGAFCAAIAMGATLATKFVVLWFAGLARFPKH